MQYVKYRDPLTLGQRGKRPPRDYLLKIYIRFIIEITTMHSFILWIAFSYPHTQGWHFISRPVRHSWLTVFQIATLVLLRYLKTTFTCTSRVCRLIHRTVKVRASLVMRGRCRIWTSLKSTNEVKRKRCSPVCLGFHLFSRVYFVLQFRKLKKCSWSILT